MGKGDRPVFRVSAKRKPNAPQDNPQFVDILAGWDAPDRPGGLSAMWDRSIVSVVVRDRKSGETVTIDLADYYCNIRDERGEQAPPPRREGRREQRSDEPAPPANDTPPDFGDEDDSLPF